jgi:hypothetical protein
MPATQCRWRDHERSPAIPREEPTRRREEEPVDRRQRGTPTLSTKNGEFVPKDDNFQLFEVVRPNAQGSELEKPTEDQVAERDKHDASRVAHSTHRLLSACLSFGRTTEILLMHPSRSISRSLQVRQAGSTCTLRTVL